MRRVTRRRVATITGAVGSGARGAGARGVQGSVGGRATHISTARDAGGSVFAPGMMATGSFAAFGGAGDW